MSRYILWPRVFDEQGRCNIPDEVLISIWAQMCVEGKDKFFYPAVWDYRTWLNHMKSPDNLPVIVLDTEANRIVFVAWLNTFEKNYAFGHFCALGKYRMGTCDMVLDFWQGFNDSDGEPLWRVILGLTPETHSQTRRFIKLMGFTELCTIPHIMHDAFTDERCGGILSAMDFEVRRKASLTGGQHGHRKQRRVHDDSAIRL